MKERGSSWSASASVEAQVETLLQHMGLEHKVNLVSGLANRSDDSADAALTVLTLTDGPAGVRLPDQAINSGRATALPAPIALAATWDTDLARRYGDLLGKETHATGHNVLLGPAVDIARAPLAGRTFESFGEDPLLQARMIVPEVQAIQAHAVMACLKHYIVNNQEYQRTAIDVQIDERALQEIYLRPFAAAVRAGGVASLMGSYNKINGTYACENAHTLTTILREQLGFRGWVMSDFMATHSTAAAANAGLDYELTMAGLWGPHLLEAVRAGDLTAATLDEMVRRILRPMIGLGLLDHPAVAHPLPVQEHGAVAREIAEQGIVLLKNASDLLPLAAATIRSIAVIGPDADTISAAGGGSALVPPAYAVSVLEGIRQRLGEDVQVSYAAGCDPLGSGALLPGLPAVPSDVLTPAGGATGEHGLRAEYWTNTTFTDAPSVIRVEPYAELNQGFFDIEPNLSAASPKLPATLNDLRGRFAVRWTGSLVAPATGDYTLSLVSFGTARLFVDGTLVAATDAAASNRYNSAAIGAAPDATQQASTRLHVAAGESHALRIDYAADSPAQGVFHEAMFRFGWQPPAETVTPAVAAAAALAAQSDLAIVVARTFESEEMDRPHLGLPNGQDALIRAVAAANPRTIVVLMSSTPVETTSWEEAVPALLEAWFGGQEQGHAVARVLFGDVNPSGKLPLTFPHSLAETPIATPAQYPGVGGVVQYSEGVFVGYRGYDQHGIAPQYPFGHGLTYTSFAYDQLDMTPETSDGTDPIQVRFQVKNTGARAGTETAQVYLGLPAVAAAPPKQLAGWARVTLDPGEQRQVTVTLDPQSPEQPFCYWDTSANGWQIANGAYQLYIGASSRDIRLTGMFDLNRTPVC